MKEKNEPVTIKIIYLLIACLAIISVSCEKETEKSLLREKIEGNYSYDLRYGIDYDTHFLYIDTLSKYSLVSKSGSNLFIEMDETNNIYFRIGDTTILSGENFRYIDSLETFTFDIPDQNFLNSINEALHISGYNFRIISRDNQILQGDYSELYHGVVSQSLNRGYRIQAAFKINVSGSDEKYIGWLKAYKFLNLN